MDRYNRKSVETKNNGGQVRKEEMNGKEEYRSKLVTVQGRTSVNFIRPRSTTVYKAVTHKCCLCCQLCYAISMLGAPKCVLLDEPSTGMDPQSKRFLW